MRIGFEWQHTCQGGPHRRAGIGEGGGRVTKGGGWRGEGDQGRRVKENVEWLSAEGSMLRRSKGIEASNIAYSLLDICLLRHRSSAVPLSTL